MYNMEHKKRGRCLIFNNSTFNNQCLPERNGTDADARALNLCFTSFGFDVERRDNPSASQIKDDLTRGNIE